MRRPMFLLALACAASAAAQQPAATNPDIVVTGRSLADTAAALAACIARDCPPDQDIAATLAHAENQFVAGEYRDARVTLTASIRRNGREGSGFPVEVSGLYRANARVAAHLGEARAFQLSILDMRDALRAGLPDSDPRVLAARIEVADSRVRLGYDSRSRYAEIARDADALGAHRVAAFARIRIAAGDLAIDRNARDPANVRTARRDLEAISAGGDRVGADMALLAEVLLARFEREEGSNARTDRLIARFAATSGARRPLMLSGDPVRLPEDGRIDDETSGNTLNRVQMRSVGRQWMDVGFWIDGTGRVSDYEILRSEGTGDWADAVELSVKSRTYAPPARDPGGAAPGFYIVERYTLTADWVETNCTGSRMRCRSPQARIERLDLTPEVDNRPAVTNG